MQTSSKIINLLQKLLIQTKNWTITCNILYIRGPTFICDTEYTRGQKIIIIPFCLIGLFQSIKHDLKYCTSGKVCSSLTLKTPKLSRPGWLKEPHSLLPLMPDKKKLRVNVEAIEQKNWKFKREKENLMVDVGMIIAPKTKKQ